MSNPIFDSYMETRLEEIEEELHQENPLDPLIPKKAYELLLKKFIINHRGASAPLLFLKCYEIYYRLFDIYVNNSFISWNMGSPSKGRHDQLLNN